MFNPKLLHRKALRRIGRYPKAARYSGYIMRSSGQLSIEGFPDVYVDGLCNFEKSNNPTCTKRRTGFLIKVLDCPMLCILKLQQEAALSTIRVKINALAHCCRRLFPVMDMVTDVGTSVGFPTKDCISMCVTVHRDNANTRVLTKNLTPQSTPRSTYSATILV